MEIGKTYNRADWHEDLKRLLKRAGCDCKPVTFLFSDSQIKEEAFVEDINNILNAGEVPIMFPADERMQVTCMSASAVPFVNIILTVHVQCDETVKYS